MQSFVSAEYVTVHNKVPRFSISVYWWFMMKSPVFLSLAQILPFDQNNRNHFKLKWLYEPLKKTTKEYVHFIITEKAFFDKEGLDYDTSLAKH